MESDDPEMDGNNNICPICTSDFASIAGLRQHWTKSHNDEETQAAIAGKMESLSQKSHSSSTTTSTFWNKLQIINQDNSDSSREPNQQFDIIENSAAGDCLFLAVIEFLRNSVNQFDYIPHSVNDLRSMVVSYISSRTNDTSQPNFNQYKHHTIENLQQQIRSLLSCDKEEDPEQAFKTIYSDYMSTPGKYGTVAELCAMAELFKFEFYVIREMNSDSYKCCDYGSISNDSGRPIMHLYFTGNVDQGHFRLLRPIFLKNGSRLALWDYRLVKAYFV